MRSTLSIIFTRLYISCFSLVREGSNMNALFLYFNCNLIVPISPLESIQEDLIYHNS